MKKLLLSLLVFATLMISCGDDCDSTELRDIIVGEWIINGFDVEFRADGSLVDSDNVFSLTVSGIELTDKSYSITGDSILTLNFSSDDPPANGSTPYNILSFECNEIVAEFLIPFTFSRK